MIFFIHILFDGVTPKIDFFQKDFFLNDVNRKLDFMECFDVIFEFFYWDIVMDLRVEEAFVLEMGIWFDLGCFVWKRPIFDVGLNVEDLVLDLNLCELWKNNCISLRGRSFVFGGGRLRKALQNLKFTGKNHTNVWQGQEGVKNRLNDVYKGFLDPYAEIFMIF